MATIHFDDDKGHAEVHYAEGDRITLLSTVAAAPGSRWAGRLPGGQPVFFKALNSVKQAGGGFVVDGRLINANRELRALLKAAVPPPEEA